MSATPVDARDLARAHFSPGPLMVADGTLEALKWAAAGVMALDHLNKFFFAEQLPGIFALGRLVMPTFGFVLVYNLSRPGAFERGVHRRMMKRLAVFGLLATPVVIALNASVVEHHAWWPLNILFTLGLVVALIALIERGGLLRWAMAVALFLVVGAFIEYLWFGVLACLGAWVYCRSCSAPRLLAWFVGVLSLTLINGNAWALAAIGVILGMSRVTLHLPRSKWFFYGFYPLHLAMLLAIKVTVAR